jgi:hypothetical protein
VLHKATLPKPESQSFSSAEVFLSSGESAGSMAQRDNSHSEGWVVFLGACPVQPPTPLGPDQVNVLLLSITCDSLTPRHHHGQAIQAELEACDRWAVQGKRVRVLQVATLPKPES